jgi:hypothetical protein
MANRQGERRLELAELREAREALAAARGRARLDLILEATDPQSLVRALPADDLYLTIREIGLGDAAALVPLASAAQFKVFVDLDAWSRDGFEPKRALPWLRAARAGAHLEPKAAARWARKLKELDREVLYLVLRDTLRVTDLEQDEDPELTADRFMRTPEGKFVVEFLVDGAEYMATKGLLDDLYAEDPFQATRLLSALRWELPSELEETALRWRAGRLADLGHPSLDEALSWFARPPRAHGEPPGSAGRPAGFWLAPLAGNTLLGRAAARLSPEERDALELQLVTAANAVIVADGVDAGDPDQVREAFQAARATLELGLEKLAGADEAEAAEVLATAPVKRIFQEGFGRALELRWRAERIAARAGGDVEGFASPVREMLEALLSRRPRYFPGIEAPREEWGTPLAGAHEPRPFRTPAELARTTAALDEVARDLEAKGR